MEANDIISIISVLTSATISIISLIFTWKDRKYTIEHTDRYNEQKYIADILSEYASTMCISRLLTYLRRSAVIGSTESANDFLDATEKHIIAIETVTVKLLSITHLSNHEFQNSIEELKSNHTYAIHRINDLKAICSLDNLSSQDKTKVSKTLFELEEYICETQDKYTKIIFEAYEILRKYTKSIK